ncbi:MAG: hypothetical protein NXI13_13840 [Proteobacteria bacterium]|nr:hypothetical protein [Pseudomonadota bacterium]
MTDIVERLLKESRHVCTDAVEEIIKLRKELAAQQWQPIETAPHDETKIELFSPYYGIFSAKFFQAEQEADYWSPAVSETPAMWSCCEDQFQITEDDPEGWKPVAWRLPTPPKEDG